MSKSGTNLRLTKAGVVLSAEALAKLHRLADWMVQELAGNQDPRVRLSYLGRVSVTSDEVNGNVTHATPLGILIQMYESFQLTDAYQPTYGIRTVTFEQMSQRVERILDIDHTEYLELLRYLYRDSYTLQGIVTALRRLK